MDKLGLYLVFLALGGCAVTRAPVESYSLGKYNFGYVLSDSDSKFITQVFDDSENTFIQTRSGREGVMKITWGGQVRENPVPLTPYE